MVAIAELADAIVAMAATETRPSLHIFRMIFPFFSVEQISRDHWLTLYRRKICDGFSKKPRCSGREPARTSFEQERDRLRELPRRSGLYFGFSTRSGSVFAPNADLCVQVLAESTGA
ncbi:hypothetical protein [Roseiarcus fermentans]|uniref:hypothetical protein n=1 Tax=Roseiarcus fermentans TaxID=1473586 RepID=UPI0011BDA128|nr:hypothetical protein [Roseiarcus fermentans]